MELANGRSKLEELENVMTEYQDKLFRFAFFRTGSYDDSQDIVQDVFIKLYNDNLISVNNIKNYLYRSVSNSCVDYHRKTANRKIDQIDTAILPCHLYEKDISEKIIHEEEYSRLQKLMSELPNEQRQIIQLRILDNLSFVEIASILEVPVTTVKSRFKYGIDKLKLKIVTSKEEYYEL